MAQPRYHIPVPQRVRRIAGSFAWIDHRLLRGGHLAVMTLTEQSLYWRWAATSLLATARSFRRIMGYQQLWILPQNLKRFAVSAEVVTQRRAG